jgi:hypothetical protein
MGREEWEDGLCKKTSTLLLLLSTGSVQMRWGVGWSGRLFYLSFHVICPCLQHTQTHTMKRHHHRQTAGRLLCLHVPHLLRSDGTAVWSQTLGSG